MAVFVLYLRQQVHAPLRVVEMRSRVSLVASSILRGECHVRLWYSPK